MNVVQHGPSDIVGICTSDTKQCDRRMLKKSELALYRIDHKKLANKLKQTFGLSEDPVPWSESDKAYKEKFIVKAADNVLRQLTG